MRDPLDIFDKTIDGCSHNWNVQNHLLDLLENLNKSLEEERKTTAELQKQLRNLTEQETFGITSKYVTLKAEYAALKDQMVVLKNENDDLQIQILAKSEENKHLLAEKDRELRTYYSTLLKQKDEEIKQKEKEIEVLKTNLTQKEKELHDEIQAAEVSSAMELNQVESNFKKQLAESNKKMKDSLETCNVLRVELMSVKEQFCEYKQSSNEKISDLQKRLRETKNFDHAATSSIQEELNNSVHSTDERSKYQPLDVSYRNFVNSDKPVNLKKTPVHRGTGKYLGESIRKTKSSVPPLKDLSTTKTTRTGVKKRKLYNPDDYSYLHVNITENQS